MRDDRRQQYGLRTSGTVSPPGGGKSPTSADESHRYRPAAYRYLRSGRPASGNFTGHRRRVVSRNFAFIAVGRLGRSRLYPGPHSGPARAEKPGARLHPADGLAIVRHQRRATAAMRRMGRHLAKFFIAVVHGPEPVHRRQREKQRPDQSASGHRANRPPGCRTVLAYRSAQCHGRARNR